tara:strand:+ start:379 stop:1311 length:933 start_codon:yes stop_codon:yes gene_type:complete
MTSKRRQQIWEESYQVRRYLIDASDDELAQRFKDILHNYHNITPEGKLGINLDLEYLHKWLELLTHSFQEFNMRGGIPTGLVNQNDLPFITYPEPPGGFNILKGEELPTSKYLVKLGQQEHIRDLYEHGRIRIAPASSYSDPSLNSAIKDEELSFSSIGLKNEVKMALMDTDGKPKGEVEPIGNVTITTSVLDYYVYCMTNKYDYRLVDDFKVDSMIVIVDPDSFGKIFMNKIKERFGDYFTYMWVPVYYADPYNINPEYYSVYFTKHFRYSYQHEYRFLMIPKTEKDIKFDPFFIELGSLSSIARFYSR